MAEAENGNFTVQGVVESMDEIGEFMTLSTN